MGESTEAKLLLEILRDLDKQQSPYEQECSVQRVVMKLRMWQTKIEERINDEEAVAVA